MQYRDQFKAIGIDVPLGAKGNVKVLCPKPECSANRKKSREKCLWANVDKGVWKCFHCGYKGVLGKRETHSNNFNPSPHPVLLSETEKSKYSKTDRLKKYFANRGISEETLGNIVFERTDKKSIAFVFREGADIVNIKLRSYDKSFFSFIPQKRLTWWNINNASEEVIITEGEIDALSVKEAGYESVVSVPNGANNLSFLEDDISIIATSNTFVLAVDKDKAGTILESELARRLGRARCRVVEYPKDCKDINDVLVKHGKEKVKECLEFAINYPIEGIHDAREDTIWERVEEIAKKGIKKHYEGLSTGFTHLDPYYKITQGAVTVITGVPGTGKSSLAEDIILNLGKQGHKTAVYSPENMPIEKHMAKLAYRISKSPLNFPLSGNDLSIARKRIDESLIWLKPEKEDIDSLLGYTEDAIYRYNVKSLLIDPYNKLDMDSSVIEKEHIRILMKKLTKFSRDTSISVFIVVHPTISRKNERPGLYGAAGSADWANQADVVLSLWRDEDNPYGMTELKIAKAKDSLIGKRGVVQMFFNSQYESYCNERDL